jgi:tetratricopeptide (TPR) repeat protein
VDCFPNVWYPTWWSGWWWYNSYPSYPQYVYSGPWYGTDPFVTDGTATTYPATTDAPAGGTQADQAAREPSPIELADAAWQAGRLTEAVRYMKEYLATAPDDADAMRFLALLKIDQGKLDEAVALMAMAYERMPRLASRPLPASDIPGGTAQMRQRVNTMSGYANRAKTGSAWLTLAVLVQGEGRDSVARTLVGRAERAGLKPTLVSELNDALSR